MILYRHCLHEESSFCGKRSVKMQKLVASSTCWQVAVEGCTSECKRMRQRDWNYRHLTSVVYQRNLLYKASIWHHQVNVASKTVTFHLASLCRVISSFAFSDLRLPCFLHFYTSWWSLLSSWNLSLAFPQRSKSFWLVWEILGAAVSTENFLL